MEQNIIPLYNNINKNNTQSYINYKYCIDDNNLLKKLLYINHSLNGKTKIDILKIKQAIYYAKKYHGNQKRLTGEPYYLHPITVTYMVSDYCVKTDVLVASILHDTLEDTELTNNIIKNIFNDDVANNVQDLTRIKDDNKKISAGKIVDLLKLQNKNELLLIKYFDRLHNIQTIGVKPNDKILKIINETLRKFINLGVYLERFFPGLLKINRILIDLCYHESRLLNQKPFDITY